MHILSVWAYWPYPEVVIEQLQKIADRGHKVSVLLGKRPLNVNSGFNGSLTFYIIPSWDLGSFVFKTSYPIFSYRIVKDVAACIKKIKPDVIHINSHLFFSNYQILRVANSMNIPSVVTVHGFMANRSWAVNFSQELYIRTVGKSLLDTASVIVCLTENDSSKIRCIIKDDSKIKVIPNYVDIDFFNPSFDRDSNLITWVGRLVPEKGIMYLLKAMVKVAEAFKNVKLLLVGDGPLRVELMSLASKLGLSNHVYFVGSFDRTKVRELLRKTSIFAFPSLREGMPLSFLEAMACGNAVIGSDISGINDVVTNRENGLLVPPRDSGRLADSIIELLENANFRTLLGQNACQTIVKNFSSNNIINKIEEVYYETINSCRTSKSVTFPFQAPTNISR